MILKKIFNLRKTTPNETGPRFFSLPRKQAGVIITPDTALQSSAVYACVRVIAEDISSLPWHVFTRLQNGKRERNATSPVEHVLDRRSNPTLGPFHFRETIISHALVWGNGYAEIVRDMAGRVAELYIISPDRVEVKRDNSGNIVYEVNNAREANSYLSTNDVFHLHGIGFDGLVGYSLVDLAARSIGLSISTEEFGAAFFGNGATLGGVIKVPQDSRLDPEAKKNARETFNKVHRGADKAHKVEILDAGMEYQEIGVDPNKGQFIESRQHQVEEICRWFRVSPQKVAHLLRMTFNNVEQLSIDHVNDALMPWIKRLEDEADYKLFSRRSNQYSRIIVNALLRGDTEARTKYYREMLNIGALSPDEIREFEDMNPIPNGDGKQYFMQMNMTTLDKIGEDPEPQESNFPTQPAEPEVTEEEAVAVLEQQIRGILVKENNRFLDLKKRYDRKEYIDQVCGHLGSQKFHVAKDICNTLMKLLTALNADTTQAEEASKIYADMHVEQSRKDAITLYDGNPPNIDERSHLMAVSIKKATLKYAKDHQAGSELTSLHDKLDHLLNQPPPTVNVNVEPADVHVDVMVDGVSKDKKVNMKRDDKGNLIAEVVHLDQRR